MDKQKKKKERERKCTVSIPILKKILDCPQGTRKIKQDGRLEMQKEMKNNMKGEYVGKSKCILAV